MLKSSEVKTKDFSLVPCDNIRRSYLKIQNLALAPVGKLFTDILVMLNQPKTLRTVPPSFMCSLHIIRSLTLHIIYMNCVHVDRCTTCRYYTVVTTRVSMYYNE